MLFLYLMYQFIGLRELKKLKLKLKKWVKSRTWQQWDRARTNTCTCTCNTWVFTGDEDRKNLSVINSGTQWWVVLERINHMILSWWVFWWWIKSTRFFFSKFKLHFDLIKHVHVHMMHICILIKLLYRIFLSLNLYLKFCISK